jgi:hypothetical protein
MLPMCVSPHLFDSPDPPRRRGSWSRRVALFMVIAAGQRVDRRKDGDRPTAIHDDGALTDKGSCPDDLNKSCAGLDQRKLELRANVRLCHTQMMTAPYDTFRGDQHQRQFRRG